MLEHIGHIRHPIANVLRAQAHTGPTTLQMMIFKAGKKELVISLIL